jgi:hypothetical protein
LFLISIDFSLATSPHDLVLLFRSFCWQVPSLEYLESLSKEERNVHDNFHKTGGGHARKFWIVDTECDLVQFSKLVDQDMSSLEVLDLPDDFPLEVANAREIVDRQAVTVWHHLRTAIVNARDIVDRQAVTVWHHLRTAMVNARDVVDRLAATVWHHLRTAIGNARDVVDRLVATVWHGLIYIFSFKIVWYYIFKIVLYSAIVGEMKKLFQPIQSKPSTEVALFKIFEKKATAADL